MFGIQICFKKDGSEEKTTLLHSKLQIKQFQDFSGQIVTYKKKEEMENVKIILWMKFIKNDYLKV